MDHLCVIAATQQEPKMIHYLTLLVAYRTDHSFLRSLSTGAGIFLGTVIIAAVLLYGQTKDRWDWSKPFVLLRRMVGSLSQSLFRVSLGIPRSVKNRWRWIVGVGAAAIVIGVAITQVPKLFGKAGLNSGITKSADSDASDSVKPRIYNRYSDLVLGMSPEDVKVLRGGPDRVDSITLGTSPPPTQRERWAYTMWRGKKFDKYHMYFYDPRLVGIEDADAWRERERNEWRYQASPAENETYRYRSLNEFKKEYGNPDQTRTSKNALARWYFVTKRGIYCKVVKGEVRSIGVYDSELAGDLPDRILDLANSASPKE